MLKAIKKAWNRAQAYTRWLSPLLSVGVVFSIVVACIVCAFWTPRTALRMGCAGIALQLVGTFMGLVALESTRKLFRLPSPADAFTAWLGRRPYRDRTIGLSGQGAGFSAGSGTLTLWTEMDSGADSATLLIALVTNVNQLRKDAAASDLRHDTAVAQVRTDMTAKIASIEGNFTEKTETLRRAQTGGLWQAFAALMMIFVGTFLSGWALFLTNA